MSQPWTHPEIKAENRKWLTAFWAKEICSPWEQLVMASSIVRPVTGLTMLDAMTLYANVKTLLPPCDPNGHHSHRIDQMMGYMMIDSDDQCLNFLLNQRLHRQSEYDLQRYLQSLSDAVCWWICHYAIDHYPLQQTSFDPKSCMALLRRWDDINIDANGLPSDTPPGICILAGDTYYNMHMLHCDLQYRYFLWGPPAEWAAIPSSELKELTFLYCHYGYFGLKEPAILLLERIEPYQDWALRIAIDPANMVEPYGFGPQFQRGMKPTTIGWRYNLLVQDPEWVL